MSKKASTTVIGAFVLGAIVLAVACVMVLGSGKFLRKTQKFVMFFDGSVKGLQIGAPVVLRGVKLGEVTDIVLQFDPDHMTMSIPVYAEIDPGRLSVIGGGDGAGSRSGPYPYYQEFLDKGLRAQLQMQSFVTGQLMVDLDLRPQLPLRLVGTEKACPEIPTVPTDMQQLSKKLEEIPIGAIAIKLERSLEGLEKLVNSPRLEATLTSVHQLVANLDSLALSARTELEGLTSHADKLASNLDGQLEAVGASARETSEAARETLARASGALEEAHGAIGDLRQIAAQNANVGYQLSQSIEQLTALTRSLRSMADYLDRHPEALVRGKGGP